MSRNVDFGMTLVTIFVFIVNYGLLTAGRTVTIVFVDTDLLILVSSTIFAWKRCFNGRITIFPSDALLLFCLSPDA